MFPLVPVQGIHVLCGESAIGIHEGFSCMHLPNVSITSVLGYLTLSHWGHYTDTSMGACGGVAGGGVIIL